MKTLTALALGFGIGLGFGHAYAAKQGQEPENLQEFKQPKITYADRAPLSSDDGTIWVKYTKASDTTMTLYLRHPYTGVWRGEDIP